MLVIPVLSRLSQEDHNYEVSFINLKFTNQLQLQSKSCLKYEKSTIFSVNGVDLTKYLKFDVLCHT